MSDRPEQAPVYRLTASSPRTFALGRCSSAIPPLGFAPDRLVHKVMGTSGSNRPRDRPHRAPALGSAASNSPTLMVSQVFNKSIIPTSAFLLFCPAPPSAPAPRGEGSALAPLEPSLEALRGVGGWRGIRLVLGFLGSCERPVAYPFPSAPPRTVRATFKAQRLSSDPPLKRYAHPADFSFARMMARIASAFLITSTSAWSPSGSPDPLRHVSGFPALGLLWGLRRHRARAL